QPLIAGGAMDAAERNERLAFAEDLFDHQIKWFLGISPRVPYQPPQPLKILRGIAQAIDVIEPQPLKLAFGNQPFDETMHSLEGRGILDAQSGQRVDVEKAPVVDVTGCKTPVPELVVLALQQMMQRADLRAAPGACAIGVQSTRNNVDASGNIPELCLERGRFAAIGTAQSLVARGQIEQGFAGSRGIGVGLLDDRVQDFAVTLRRDRQAVL